MAEQLIKKTEEGYSNVMPKSWIEAITDKSTGESLTHILQGFNMYFLSYTGNTEQTRCQVSKILRKKGLWITYVKYDGNVYTEWYNSNDIDDKSWGNSSNWRVGNNELVGDLTISANGNWVINGNETEFRAVGENGNTPLIRIANNKLQVSYDTGNTYHNVDDNPVYIQIRIYNNKLQISTDLGANWVDASDEIAAYFRFNSGQGNNVGNIQISRNNKDWSNLSGNFVNNLHISKYIGADETLPTSGVAEGTIYAKGPTYADSDTSHNNPIYRLWVYAYKGNTLTWQDNGEFTSISAGVVQELGNSENLVVSQKCVSQEIIQGGVYDVSAHNNNAVFESLQALLSSSNLSTLIPTSVRHGGISIRFVQSSDNKYVQYRLMANIFSTTVTDWQGVDDEPIAGSDNLVKSGGVEKRLYDIDGLSTYVDKKTINSSGVISDNNSFFISVKIPIKSGDTIFWKYSTSAVVTLFCVFDQNDNALGAWNGNNSSDGQRTFTITYETASYAIASFDRNSDYTPLVKVNGKIVWTKKEKGAIELINEKIVPDKFPSFGSENFVKSNGIFIDSLYTKINIDNVDIKESINSSKHNGYVDNLGTVLSYNANWFYSDPILLKAGYRIVTGLSIRSDVSTLSIAHGDSVDVGDTLTPINSKTYKATEDVYIVISGRTSELNKPIYITNGNVRTPLALIEQIDKDFYGIGNTVRNKYIGYDGTIYDNNDWNIISLEVNQNDSVTWVVGALRGNATLVVYDINDNVLDYYSVNRVLSNKDSTDIEFSNYPNAHHIVASFSKFLLNGDENTTPLVINDVGIKSIERTSKGTYDTVKELSKRVSEICSEPYDEYGVIGINYPSEVKKVIEDIDKNILGTKLHFCHTSDNHGGGFGYANEFTDLSPAKFLVNTGDLVVDKFNDSFDKPKGLILAMNKPGFIVLGNHDVYKSTSLQERFEKYFAPLNEHNGLTGNTKTYYSVDYPQEKVKCIFLDMNDGWDNTSDLSMGYFISKSKMSSEQINWFAQELISAKTNNLHVTCFIHVSPDYVNYEKSPIDFYDYQVEKATNVAFLCDMIDKFIEGGTVTFTHNEQEYTFSFVAGGHFVGWFCGHMHCDCSGWMLNHPKQFSISVPRPGWNSMEEDGTYRIPKLGITFNYVTIDTKFQRLSILRIGNNKTIWGTPREGFSIRYN